MLPKGTRDCTAAAKSPRLRMLSWLLLTVCCGSSDPKATDNSNSTKDASTEERDAASQAGTDKVGDFSVRLVPPTPAANGVPETAGFTSVTGKVYDGPVPDEIAWNTAAEAEGCVLLKPKVPFCDPPCVGEVCVADGRCLPNPSALDVGEVSLKGLTSKDGKVTFALKQIANVYSAPAEVDLPYPAFAEGDAIELSAKGASQGAFSITARGISPLALADDPLTLDPAAPLTLRWAKSTMAGVSRIHVKLDISHHGGTKGKIECDVEDSGSLDIPASMIATLTGLGVAGFPTIVLTRQSVASAAIKAGRVDLTVYSDVERSVDIAGLVSCTDTAQCPAGSTCQSDLTCK